MGRSYFGGDGFHTDVGDDFAVGRIAMGWITRQ
jgi:hypothetical protein